MTRALWVVEVRNTEHTKPAWEATYMISSSRASARETAREFRAEYSWERTRIVRYTPESA